MEFLYPFTGLVKHETPTNLLRSYGFNSFVERQNSLIDYIEKYKDKELSDFLNFPIYTYFAEGLLRWYDQGKRYDILENGKWKFKGVYLMSSLDNYIGEIPISCQKSIVHKIKILQKNPFIKYKKLYVLAPSNNFAFESNIKAIDPIVFALCDIKTDTYFIPLAQWI